MFADDECDSVGCQSTTIRSKSRCTYSLVSLDRYAESAMESHIVRNCSFAGWIVRWSHPTPYLCDAFYYALAAAAVSGAAMDCYHSRWHSSGSVTLTNTAIPIAIRLVDGSPLRRYLRIPKILRTLAPLCRAKPSGGHLSRFSNFGQKRKKKWFSNASSVIENRVWIPYLVVFVNDVLFIGINVVNVLCSWIFSQTFLLSVDNLAAIQTAKSDLRLDKGNNYRNERRECCVKVTCMRKRDNCFFFLV